MRGDRGWVNLAGLKAIRAGDADAWERFAAVLDDPPRSPGLRDVQLALARAYGMPGWRHLTHAVLGDARWRGISV